MLFKNIIGNKELKKHLIQSVNDGRISHAQLFLGAEGSGNLAIALAYVQYVFCQNRQEDDACNECSNCKKISKLVHPDVHFSFPYIRSTKEKETADTFVGEFREAVLANPYLSLLNWYEHLGHQDKQGLINVKESQSIIEKLSLKSFEGGYKVYMIWMPEKLNGPAANKLLKTIEEPPDKTIIILVANDSEQIIPTILSRTQLIRLNRLEDHEVSQGLIDAFETEQELASNLALMSEGDFNMARELALNAGAANDNFVLFRDWMRLCFKKDIKGINKWVESASRIGRVKQKDFLKYALHLVRQCALFNYEVEDLVKIKGEERVFMQKFAPFIDHENLEDYIQLFTEARQNIDRNANAKIMFTDISYRILVLLKAANQRIKKAKA